MALQFSPPTDLRAQAGISITGGEALYAEIWVTLLSTHPTGLVYLLLTDDSEYYFGQGADPERQQPGAGEPLLPAGTGVGHSPVGDPCHIGYHHRFPGPNHLRALLDDPSGGTWAIYPT